MNLKIKFIQLFLLYFICMFEAKASFTNDSIDELFTIIEQDVQSSEVNACLKNLQANMNPKAGKNMCQDLKVELTPIEPAYLKNILLENKNES